VNVLDLFSGIGGFSLGLERAGFSTIAFAEIDEWCQCVLRKHWPSVPQLGDVMKLGVEPISLSVDSPAKTSAKLVVAPALPASVPLSGGGYAVPFAWYDHATRLWRTWQLCVEEGWAPFSGTWPRSGMTLNGIAYQLPTLAPLTYGTGYGQSPSHSIPTPTASDHIKRRSTSKEVLNFNTNKSVSLDRWCRRWPDPSKGWDQEGVEDGIPNPEYVEWLMDFKRTWTELKDSGTPSCHESQS
jgi:hypothetical protein